MKTTPVLFLLLFIVFFHPVEASAAEQENQCGPDADRIIRLAYPSAIAGSDREYSVEQGTITAPENGYIGWDPHAAVCRYWPANPDKLLVAVPIMRGENQDGVGEGDLDILVLDSGISHVKTRLHIPGFITEDAIRPSRILFDTAPYRLVSGRIAFGVRMSMENNSRVNPFAQTTLRLYDLDADRLMPVTEDVVVEQSHGESDGNCAGEFWKVARTLAVSSGRHNGAADIVVTSREQRWTTKARDGVCEDGEKNDATATHLLRFDGRTYPVPEALKP